MKMDGNMCLRSPETVDWALINWAKVRSDVKQLQSRIVKAVEEGKTGKVKSLQRILTRSFSARALSVRRVTENKGKRTAGVDGELWKTPSSKAKAIQMLNVEGYKAKPLKRIYIPKSNGKKRPLGIPTMFDRAMQALYLLALDPVSETKADLDSYGFRKHRSTKDAIEQSFLSLCRKGSAEWVLEGDIKGCFDNISHDWLLQNIPMEKRVLRQWLKSGYFEKDAFFSTEAGTPQGGIISPVLANMTLDGLEQRLNQRFRKLVTTNGIPQWVNRRGQKNMKVNYVRYADDFIVTGHSKEFLEQQVKPLIEEFMSERGLSLSDEKTKVTHIEEGFDFLGMNLRKYGGSVLSKPSKKSIQNIKKKIRETVREERAATAYALVGRLNSILRGWANYHRSACSSKAFSHISNYLWHTLKRWAYRRHPNKPRQWIVRKYFKSCGNRNWIFYGSYNGKVAELFDISAVKIQRHTKVRNHLNPYDPQWEEYIRHRAFLSDVHNHKRGSRKAELWKNQMGMCPVCKHPLAEEYEFPQESVGVHIHHIVKIEDGGTDGMENLVLLHPACHRQIHTGSNQPEADKASFPKLEPDAGKLASPVLRGERKSDLSAPTRP